MSSFHYLGLVNRSVFATPNLTPCATSLMLKKIIRAAELERGTLLMVYLVTITTTNNDALETQLKLLCMLMPELFLKASPNEQKQNSTSGTSF